MGAIDQYRQVDEVMRFDLERYSRAVVKIKDKDTGQRIPFQWKRSQLVVHEALEKQRRETGKVRALILKYRQGGISTYVAARYYHATSLNMGVKTYILTHEDKGTSNLFGMAKAIHEHMAVDYRPRDTAKNANELWFGGLDSGYAVGTAQSNSGTGRSSTIHRFHGSEVAFWRNAEEHFAGVLQAVPQAAGTEIIMETTANGPSGAFYNQWMLAQRGDSAFIAIFLPWFWEEAYRSPRPDGFQFSEAEVEYADTYGLDEEQLTWAHFKNIELGGEPGKFGWYFSQEYPASASEAFQTSGSDSFINARTIMEARKYVAPDQGERIIVLGADIARGGDDRTRLIDRQGRAYGRNYNLTWNLDDEMVIADQIALILHKDRRIKMVNIDITGVGGGVYTRLKQLGYDGRVAGINFGAGASDPNKYQNKRAEMWGDLRDDLKTPGADIPDDDLLHSHLAAPGYRYDANSRLILEKKEDIKKRVGFSPDGGDAMALTHGSQVVDRAQLDDRPEWMKKLRAGKGGGGFMSR